MAQGHDLAIVGHGGDLCDQGGTDAGVFRAAGARRDQHEVGPGGTDLGHGHLVIASHNQLIAVSTQILDQVVDKRVVIVDDVDHRGSSHAHTFTPTAAAIAASFARHSSYSCSGTESCTMPAPACRVTVP